MNTLSYEFLNSGIIFSQENNHEQITGQMLILSQFTCQQHLTMVRKKMKLALVSFQLTLYLCGGRGGSMWEYIWRPEINTESLPQSLSILVFESGPLIEPEAHQFIQTMLPIKLQGALHKTKSFEMQLSSVPGCFQILPFHIDALTGSQGIQAGQNSVTRHLHILH